jgi:hypothetical protein
MGFVLREVGRVARKARLLARRVLSLQHSQVESFAYRAKFLAKWVLSLRAGGVNHPHPPSL